MEHHQALAVVHDEGLILGFLGAVVQLTVSLVPQPESSRYLRHTAYAIVFLRARGKASGYNRAFLIDHPSSEPEPVE